MSLEKLRSRTSALSFSWGDDWDTSHWRTYADMLEIWTGQHFPLDNYALYEKQFRQYDAILAWLEEHRHEYKVGAWYRWGKQLPVA